MHTARRNEQDLVQVVLDIATVNLTDQRPRCQVLRRSELGVNPAQKTREMHVNRTSGNRSAKGGDWERESGITRGLPNVLGCPGEQTESRHPAGTAALFRGKDGYRVPCVQRCACREVSRRETRQSQWPQLGTAREMRTVPANTPTSTSATFCLPEPESMEQEDMGG